MRGPRFLGLACHHAAGIALDQVTDDLLDKGIATFTKDFDNLLTALDHQVRAAVGAQSAAPASP